MMNVRCIGEVDETKISRDSIYSYGKFRAIELNIETVCKDLADKINSSLQSGNVVLAKIADVEQSEQSKAELGGTAEVVQTVPVQPVVQVGQPAVQVGQPAGFNMSAVDMNGIASQANANTINWNN